MNQIALPVSGSSSRTKWTLWAFLSILAVLCVAGAWTLSGPKAASPITAQSMLYTISPVDMDIKINKDGELQATNNIEISSLVEGTTTIQTIVPEGSTVKKGDVLIH